MATANGTPPAIIVMAKAPLPGAVKTRLSPPCRPAQAALLAEAALVDTLDAVARTPASRRIIALAGRPGRWLPPGFEVIPQVQGDLDVRIAAALAMVDRPAVVIGMDTPQVSPALLSCDFAARPAWLGRAEDGGFWALGLAEPTPSLVRGVPMSVSWTGARQRSRLDEAGLAVGELPVLRDVDTWDDALAVAGAAPGTRFAAEVRRLGVLVPGGW